MIALAAGIIVMAVSPLARAQINYGHNPPVTHAAVEFAADFPQLEDSEWGIPLGGFGGTKRGEVPTHVPVIFVHGNNVDACDWKLVRDDFQAAGWSAQALWALSYNGLGNDVGNEPSRPDNRCSDEHAERNGGDSVSRITGNEINVPDLYAFILAVREYTGSARYSLVTHSLGVTLARRTLKVYPELRQDLLAFVGIAGGNHGTSLCPPGSADVLYSCDELEAGSAWLAELNGSDASDETYGSTRWLTIYDGSGSGDVAYAPGYEQSPRLEGADNREYPGLSHNALRVAPDIVTEYRQFLEEAEASMHSSPHDAGSGGGGSLPLGFSIFLLLTRLARTARRGRIAQLGAPAMVLALCSGGASAAGLVPAHADFPPDFTPPTDSELDFSLGGFGGHAGMHPSHPPVIFVHGNTSDACDWKLARDDFLAAGWNQQALWALSYHGMGLGKGIAPARPDERCRSEQRGQAGIAQITDNETNVADLAAFIKAVQRYTGSQHYSLVGHSLGVTLARRTLQLHPELRTRLIAFVGIAGANHGTSLCPPGSEALYTGCAEISAGSSWLQALNGPDGRDETYSPTLWLTIFDGSGKADIAFQGELAQSPQLRGAENRDFPGTSHNDLRLRPDIVTLYRQFIEQAIRARDERQRRQRHFLGR